MIKRLVKAILIMIMLLFLAFIELPYYAVRWLITGKSFGEPLIDELIEW